VNFRERYSSTAHRKATVNGPGAKTPSVMPAISRPAAEYILWILYDDARHRAAGARTCISGQ